MGRRVRTLTDEPGEVVPLGVEPVDDPPPPSRPHSTLHSAAVTGMSLSALLGICVLFFSIGVGLPDAGRRVAMAIIVGAVVLFLACASTAVFTAARETYPSRGREGGE